MLLFYLSIIDNEEDRVKFEDLYKKFRGPMKHYATKFVGDEHLAEDIVHEAFIRIARHMDGVGKIDCPKTNSYIVTIVKRICIDTIRAEKKNQHISYDEEYDLNFTPQKTECCFAEIELNDLIQKIKELPEIYRDVLLFKFYHGYTNKEIANAFSISVYAVHKRVERARELLEFALGDRGK